MKISTAEIKTIIREQIKDGENYTPSDFENIIKNASSKSFTGGQLAGAIKQLADNGDILRKERGLYCRPSDASGVHAGISGQPVLKKAVKECLTQAEISLKNAVDSCSMFDMDQEEFEILIKVQELKKQMEQIIEACKA